MTDLTTLRDAPHTAAVARQRAPLAVRARAGVLVIALVALAGFAFAWVWQVGHRGLFVLDESIVFDGAWRVQQGQVPYRDFLMPFGPVTFWLQGLMFHWVGVDFSTLVLTAALLSVIATLAVVRLLWLLTSGSATWSLLGGLLTAVWYQAPFGIPWMEQTAFLFDLLALLLVVEGRLRVRRANAWFVAAGVASVLAILSKQNAGGLFVGVCVGCLCLPWRGPATRALRALACYGAGGLAAALAFLVWLVVWSKPALFAHYWLSVSAGVGWERVAYWKIIGTLTFQPLLGTSLALFMASSFVGVAALVRSHSGPRTNTIDPFDLRIALCGWLCLSLPQFHSFFQLTTNNDAPNNNAFVGVCVAAAAWLLGQCLRGVIGLQFRGQGGTFELAVPRAMVWAALIAFTSVGIYSVAEGLSIAWTRNVQEFMGASFTEPVALPRARRLLWGEPTRITPQFCNGLGEMCKISGENADRERPFEILHRRDLERIAAELERRHENFFVFPDTTILYGLLGRPSPQPLLYFHPGQSYALADQADLDHQVVRSLQKNAVELIVLERASFMGTHKLLGAFPELQHWLESDFRLVTEIGNYRLFERHSK